MMWFSRFILAFLLTTIGGFWVSAEVYTVETGQFQKLKIDADISLVYKNISDSVGMARYEAPEGNEGIFVFNVKKDGTLNIDVSDRNFGQKDLPVVYVYSDFLNSVESYSNFYVLIESVAPCTSFTATQIGNGTVNVEGVEATTVGAAIKTGNGTVNISGECETATLQMLGTGLISADRLKAETVKCKILGTGSIGCWPLQKLDVKGIGTTKIYYRGKPEIKKMGGGKLFELDQDFED